jgi:hypothetical protein
MSADSSNESARKGVSSCSASTTFNFTVGAVAIVVACVIGYFVYAWFAKG